jgi:hypothetical protein
LGMSPSFPNRMIPDRKASKLTSRINSCVNPLSF